MADDSDDFDENDGDDDSFDDDFEANDEEDELPGEDDEFDMEAYLKWRAENPDEGVQPAGDDPGGELPEESGEADDYDDEDD